MKLGYFLTLYTKTNSKWIKDKYEARNYKTIRGKHRQNTLWHKWEKIIFDPPPRVIEIKPKINKWIKLSLKVLDNIVNKDRWNWAVVSDSSKPHGLWYPRLLQSRDSPGKNTGVCCHFLLQGPFWSRDWTRVCHIAGRLFTIWATRESQSKQQTRLKDSLHSGRK